MIDSLSLAVHAFVSHVSMSFSVDETLKRSFFQPAVVSIILLYGCTTWTLTKRLEKKLDGNYTRMLRAILNKSWRQHPTRHQLYGHLPPITKTIQVRRTRHEGHSWRSRDDQLEHTFSSYVRIRDVALKRWTIGRSGESGSGISVPATRHDDDDDIEISIGNLFVYKFIPLSELISATSLLHFVWLEWCNG